MLLDSYRYAKENGLLSNTQRRGIISLTNFFLNPLLLKSWRPLSLLNVDYKLLAETIAARIKPDLLHIIHDDQTWFIKTRYIGESICWIHDIMNFAENEDIPAQLIVIDFEKPFDCLEWVSLRDCMLKFNFPDYILRWMEILYTDINSCVTNNGHVTKYLKLERGVRHGCPLSPYLFIIVVEVLALAIRHNNNITGIKIGDQEFQIS